MNSSVQHSHTNSSLTRRFTDCLLCKLYPTRQFPQITNRGRYPPRITSRLCLNLRENIQKGTYNDDEDQALFGKMSPYDHQQLYA